MPIEDGSRPRTVDGLTGVIAATIGIVLIVATRHLPYFDRTGPGPALAPAIIGAALVACGIALIASGRGVPRLRARPDRVDARIGAGLAGLLAASVAIDRIGLAPTVVLLVLWSARVVAGGPLVHALALATLVGAGLAAAEGALGLPLALGASSGESAGSIR